MKRIPLSQGYFAKVDNRDYMAVSAMKWAVDLRSSRQAYAQTWTRKPSGQRISKRMHTVIAELAGLGTTRIDHINGDGLDNRRANLRSASALQNAWNQRPQRGQRFKGITKVKRLKKNPWHARIKYGNKHIHIGYFATEVEAAIAYNLAAKDLYGEFARLNPVAYRRRTVTLPLDCGHIKKRAWNQLNEIGKRPVCDQCGAVSSKKGAA
jgi:hypothetical protein